MSGYAKKQGVNRRRGERPGGVSGGCPSPSADKGMVETQQVQKKKYRDVKAGKNRKARNRICPLC